MRDVSDMELLRRYVREASEEAFAELVRRHINLVYSAASRQVAIFAQADEITQAVFVILSRKAAGLRPETNLAGWLYETTRLTSLNWLRGERRRLRREQEAYMQSTLEESSDVSAWKQLAPLLDDAMAQLEKKDREALVLRFFQEKSLSQVASALRVTETAAQSRVYRAVEKLRGLLTRRGVALSTAVLIAAMSAHSIQAAPALLARSVIAVGITKAAATGSASTLVNETLKIMAWTKAKTLTTAAIALACIATTTSLVVQHSGRPLQPRPVASTATDFPKSAWAFAGYGDPKSAYMSFLWSHTAADFEVLRRSLTPEERERELQEFNTGAKRAGKSLGAYFASRKELPNVDAYEVLGEQAVADGEVILEVEMRGAKGTSPHGRARMRKLGNEWKFDGMVEDTRQ